MTGRLDARTASPSGGAGEVPARSEFAKGLWRDNPVLVNALGMCPVLAVSNTATNALTLGLATLMVLCASNVTVSILRRLVPSAVRIVTYVLIIATFVTVVDRLIQTVSVPLHRALGPFISLIVVNCLIVGRAEAFASKHPPLRSLLDALGMGGGFVIALVGLGAVRELLGSGRLFGAPVLPESFQPWVMMVLPSGGFFALAGGLVAIRALQRWRPNRALARDPELAP